MRTINKWITLSIVLSALMVLPTTVFGAGPVIMDTAIDYSNKLINIYGQNFGSQSGTVRLAGTSLGVRSWSPAEIVAALPASLTAGSYVLAVTTLGKLTVAFDVTYEGPSSTPNFYAGNLGPSPTPGKCATSGVIGSWTCSCSESQFLTSFSVTINGASSRPVCTATPIEPKPTLPMVGSQWPIASTVAVNYTETVFGGHITWTVNFYLWSSYWSSDGFPYPSYYPGSLSFTCMQQ